MAGSQLQHGMQIPERWQDRLPATLGCSGRSAELIQRFQHLLSVVEPGTEVFTQSVQPTAIYLLIDGMMEMVACRGCREARIGKITSGMMCDIAACILDTPHTFSARSMIPCELVVLPMKIWQRLMEESPTAAIRAAGQLCTDMSDLLKNISSQ